MANRILGTLMFGGVALALGIAALGELVKWYPHQEEFWAGWTLGLLLAYITAGGPPPRKR